MANLATQLDLEKYGHVDITAEPDASITARLESASAIIETYCGRTFTSATVTAEVHDGRTHTIWLRQPPVTSITTVVENTVTLTPVTDYMWYPDGRLHRLTATVPVYLTWWYPALQTVTVTYVGGYNPVPFDVRLVCVRIAERAFKAAAAWSAAPVGAGAITSISLEGSDSVTYSDAVTQSVAAAAVPLTDEDKEILNPYRIVNVA